jgi:purine nucleosidase
VDPPPTPGQGDDVSGRPTVLLHDGAIDEFCAAAMLLTAPEIDLLATVVVNADCVGLPALEVQWRVQDLLGRPEVPLGLSAARAVNAFPWSYRGDCVAMQGLAVLRSRPGPGWDDVPDGDALLERVIEANPGVAIVALGPVAPLTDLLARRPELAAHVGSVVWMAGALAVAGNLDPATLVPGVANPFAEWNVFWDPYSAQRLIADLDVPTTLVPLDVSNLLPLTDAWRSSLVGSARTSTLARLAFEAYSLIDLAAEPFYRLWDTTTVSWVLAPELFAPVEAHELTVVTDLRGDVGALVPATGVRPVDVVTGLGPGGAAAIEPFITGRLESP